MPEAQKREPSSESPEPLKEVELKTTLIEVFGDRFKSHTLGGFALAWLAIHWEAIYVTVILSTTDLPKHDDTNRQILNKLDYVKTLGYCLWTDLWVALGIALLVPVVASFFDEIVIKLIKKWFHDGGLWLRGRWANAWVVDGEVHQQLTSKYDTVRGEKAQLEKRVREFEEKEKALDIRQAAITIKEGEIRESANAYQLRGAEMAQTVERLSNELRTYRSFRRQLPSVIRQCELAKQLIGDRDFAPAFSQGLQAMRDLVEQTSPD